VSTFFRFPHIPHLAWLGVGAPRDDKVLAPTDVRALLSGDVVVEEKIDGANLGISLGRDGGLRFQNRGQYIQAPFSGQFQRLGTWLSQHQSAVSDALTEDQIAFGEWCTARHSVAYDRLPDWFVLFDVYDRTTAQFMSTERRDSFAARAEIAVVPSLFRGHTSLAALKELLLTTSSRYRTGTIEGFVIRRESGDWLRSRAKLVHPDFVQNIGEHRRQRRIEWNRLQGASIDSPRTRSQP
jgi:ATP-dependent RNA circularization protein (DNA/RNA ligase family)